VRQIACGVEEESHRPTSNLQADMGLAQRRKRAGPGLLAVLLFISASLSLRVPPGSRCLAAAAHACCCAHAGLTKCNCCGHAGTASQLASLAACSGDLPSFVMASSPALFVLPQPVFAPLQRCGAAPVAVIVPLPFLIHQPFTPPPQAA
jgi:hypothetical protein